MPFSRLFDRFRGKSSHQEEPSDKPFWEVSVAPTRVVLARAEGFAVPDRVRAFAETFRKRLAVVEPIIEVDHLQRREEGDVCLMISSSGRPKVSPGDLENVMLWDYPDGQETRNRVHAVFQQTIALHEVLNSLPAGHLRPAQAIL